MKTLFLAALVAFAIALGCGSNSNSTTQSASPTTAPALTGTWTGDAQSVMQWTRQRTIPLDLTINDDRSVTGTVGDAKLQGAKLVNNRGQFERALNLSRDFRISGRLEGDIISAEQIHRDAVDIVFDAAPDGTLVGGFTTSGTEFGGKESMKLAAGTMTLKKQ